MLIGLGAAGFIAIIVQLAWERRGGGEQESAAPVNQTQTGGAGSTNFQAGRDINYNEGQEPQQVNLCDTVMFTVGEVDTFAALASRGGSTVMPELRKAWMGERLGLIRRTSIGRELQGLGFVVACILEEHARRDASANRKQNHPCA